MGRRHLDHRRGHFAGRSVVGLALALLLSSFALAAEDLSRLTLREAISVLEDEGLTVFYSSDLVKPWMLVRESPAADEPMEVLDEILAPYGLTTEAGPEGSRLVVRAEAMPAGVDRAAVAPEPARDEPAPAIEAPVLEEIVVNASLYRLRRDQVTARRTLGTADLAQIPELGDDPLRVVARLPGAAAGDFTARTNVRGGDSDEMLVRFDDFRLYDPFHLKDFQGVFSSIDPSVVSDIDVYTGGFPVIFGDRMSGVVDIEPFLPEDGLYREISLSLFNAGVVLAGDSAAGDNDWLVAGRRGNLDLLLNIVDSSLGEPNYNDFYGRYRRSVSDSLTLTLNGLLFDDDIQLFDGDREERAEADYRDEYVWLRADYEPHGALAGTVLVGRSRLSSFRRGSTEQEGISSGSLHDRRDLTIDSVQADFSHAINRRMALEFGGEFRRATGRYELREDVAFDLLFDTPGVWQEPERFRDFRLRREGEHYGLYSNLRIELGDRWTLQTGVRWDKDTLSPDQASHVSPRLALMYRPTDRATLRASWGRFFQSQSIHELQVADGITRFSPAQRSDHLVLSLDYRLRPDIDLRLETYRKSYGSLRPRFENLVNTFVLLPELKPDRIRIEPDGALARGTEVSLRSRGDDKLDWWVSYVWAQVEDEFDEDDISRSWDQTHSLNAGIAWRGERWDFSAAARSHTGWPTTPIGLAQAEPVAIAETGPRNSTRFSAYHSLDVRVARRFPFSDTNNLTVFLEVRNLLARENPCCLEYEFEDEDGEAILDTKTIDYLPIFPSIGFIWRF